MSKMAGSLAGKKRPGKYLGRSLFQLFEKGIKYGRQGDDGKISENLPVLGRRISEVDEWDAVHVFLRV